MTRIAANWIDRPATQAVCAALAVEGAQVLFVGGCVRNTLLGVAASDIDIATDAWPDAVMQLAKAAGIKAIPTGIDHGTITLVKDGLVHEVTTFRKDITTDGRRATVAFSSHITEDAARRDFTMNALYATPDGTVIDPLGGMDDLRAGRVRFIGQAQDRIAEDYLRSLRYFRFHAWYGDIQAGFDTEALAAIAANLDGLKQLSRERVGAEMLKLLAAPDPAPSLAAMRSVGVLCQVLPGADDRALAPLVDMELLAGADPDPLRRLAALGGRDVTDALRLSRAHSARLEYMRAGIGGSAGAAELGYRMKPQTANDVLLLRAALLETPWDNAVKQQVEAGANAQFPIRAKDLMPALQGRDLGARLAQLETLWIASGFTLTRDDLLSTPR